MNNNSQKENLLFIVLISMAATIGGFLFGFDSGVINGTVDGLTMAFKAKSIGQGFNVASMLLGCAVGAFAAGTLADLLGRKGLLVIASVFFVISAWGSGIANSSAEFIFYRILGGLAVGAASVMAPAYIAEIAPARMRGSLATIQQIAIIFGLFSAFISNYFLANAAGGSTQVLWLDYQTWRWMFWVELVPAVIFFVCLLVIPESPRFLVIKGKHKEAKGTLIKLYGEDQAKQTIDEIEKSLTAVHHQPKLSDLMSGGKVRTIVWVGVGLAMFQQLVGINVVFYYGAVLWQAVGYSESDSLMINVIVGAVSIIACVITISLIDKLGRRPFLIIGSAGMTVNLLTLVWVFANAGVAENGNLILGGNGTLALISANAYVFFFNLSWGPIMWVMLGEMFPNQIRGSGLAIAGFVQWTANFLITMTFPIMLTSIGLASAYGFYALCALLSVAFVVTMVKETKGKTLESMQG
jgi:SP family sugar:H+ symporter-like MFS transporter